MIGAPPATVGAGLVAYFRHAGGADFGADVTRQTPLVDGLAGVPAHPETRRSAATNTNVKSRGLFRDICTRFLRAAFMTHSVAQRYPWQARS
jgi:hypothetical protein